MSSLVDDVARAAKRLEDVEDELATYEGMDEIRETVSRVRRDPSRSTRHLS